MKDILALILLAGSLLLATTAHAVSYTTDYFTFDTLPGTGSVSGPAGTTVGWGYTVTVFDDAPGDLVFDAIDADLFSSVNDTPEAYFFDFPIVSPGTLVATGFDAANFTGLYGLTWNAGLPVGTREVGNFYLTAHWGDAIDNPFTFEIPYEALVSAPVPEPATWLLVTVGLGGLYFRRRRHLKGAER